MDNITLDEYKQWLDNKNINPKTKRKIKPNNKIYKLYDLININDLYIKETIDCKDPISLNDFWIERDGIKEIVYKNINNLVFYTDSSNKIRGFEKESLSYMLGYSNKIHPVTGNLIPDHVFENIIPSTVIEDTDKTIAEVADTTNKEMENPATTDNPSDQSLESEPVPNVSFNDEKELDFIRTVGTRSHHFSKEFN
jgi:hypothetical protein